MAKQETNQPGAKYAIVKAGFDLEANKKNYQLLLQNLSSVTVTKDNVNDDLTKDGREILSSLTNKKDEESAEPLQWHKDIMSAYKSLYDPLKEQIDRINSEKKIVAAEIKAEADKQLAEQMRINNAKTAIVSFTNKIANLIANATTDNDVVSIEKMIGTEKTRSTVYQEFVPELIEKCDALRPQIKEQKENIRRLQKIEEQEKKALESGSIYEATALREEKEQIQQVIAETGIRIHETAYEQATTIDIVAPEVADVTPKGRTNWKWRVDDIKLLQKKMPHLVKLVPDDDAIELLLKTKRADGSLKDKMEENVFGLIFYNDKSFTR
jgi:flagellar biosynthesis/type III secretory pathway chaperone